MRLDGVYMLINTAGLYYIIFKHPLQIFMVK